MPINSPAPSDRTPIRSSRSLTDRVKARVAEAGLALEGGTRPAAPRSKKPARSTRPGLKASSAAPMADTDLEARSLRRVYGELRATYHRYRRSTGSSAVPALRDAVRAFRRGPSLTSLVGVAVFLEDRSLLKW